MILLSAQNISKTYMERKVLDQVSFFLNEGDKVGIVGINGTGKSTLLRILAGAEEADGGTVVRTGGVRISYLPQIPAFLPFPDPRRHTFFSSISRRLRKHLRSSFLLRTFLLNPRTLPARRP